MPCADKDFMFLILVKYLKPISEIEKALVAHREFLQKHYDLKNLVCSGPQNPRTGGLILSRQKNRADVEKMIAEDPFKTQGLADYQIIEFDPVKKSTEFEKCL